MIRRVADEIRSGMTVNLGIGLPTRVIHHVDSGLRVWLHSENGIAGVGPTVAYDDADRNLIDAGGAYVSTLPGTSFFDSAVSFALVRGGRLDLSVLGAFEVAMNGDLANWMIPGKMVKGMGGAMDLVAGVKRVVVVMEHTAKGKPKLLKECTLPLTGTKVVDLVITDLGVFEIDKKGDGGMTLIEMADDVTLEEIANNTEAAYQVAKGL
jgi:3-oxoacid CoA-transferase subunit B